jgi:hypothetical protein
MGVGDLQVVLGIVWYIKSWSRLIVRSYEWVINMEVFETNTKHIMYVLEGGASNEVQRIIGQNFFLK